MDWEMPVLNGLDTLSELKKKGVSIPVLIMTTKNSPEDIAQMLDRGASEYLMKPFTIDILFYKIELCTGKFISYAE